MTKSKSLEGKVAVVAGATRGAGRGVARALGEAGAIVYCTGRSVRGNPSSYRRPETIEETAEMLTAEGGNAIAVRVDHSVEAEVRALFERIEREHGRLDVLADSVAGEDPILGGWTPFWDTDLEHGAAALRQALLSRVITAQHAAHSMMKKKRGVIVEVTEFDLLLGGGNVLSDLVRVGTKALVARIGEELKPHGVAALAITPGFLRSETMLERFGVTADTWRDAGKKDPNFLYSESPLFIGRAVAALAADPKVIERTGDLTSSWELAREYGFTDADGSRPDWGAHFASILATSWMKPSLERHGAWLERLLRRARAYLGKEDSPSRGSSASAAARSAAAREVPVLASAGGPGL